MTLIRQDWTKLGDTVASSSTPDRPLAFQRLEALWYMTGNETLDGAPHYPVPALFVDSVADLGERWSQWLDTDAMYGHRH